MLSLAERMLRYEEAESSRTFMPGLPILARLDGRNFSAYTKPLMKPFDSVFSSFMDETTEVLIKQSGALAAFTQSDEITLLLWNDNPEAEPYHGGRILKLCSSLAAIASAKFTACVADWDTQVVHDFPPLEKRQPTFDCRAWQVPNMVEATAAFSYRSSDCKRNSILQFGHSLFSHAEMLGKSTRQVAEMAKLAGHEWEKESDRDKFGALYAYRNVVRKFDATELEGLPPKHAAHANPDLLVERQDLMRYTVDFASKVMNKTGVLFHGVAPRFYPEGLGLTPDDEEGYEEVQHDAQSTGSP